MICEEVRRDCKLYCLLIPGEESRGGCGCGCVGEVAIR